MKLTAAVVLGIFGLSVKASSFDAPTLVDEPGKAIFVEAEH